MIAKRAIVVAGGASIREGDWSIPSNELPVWPAIQEELTIGINWVFRYFNPTLTLYGDYQFYIAEKEKLKMLPLVFGMQDGYYGNSLKTDWTKLYYLENNIYLLPNRVDREGILYHGINAWKYGFYSRYLSGILGINLAVALGCTEIMLLGFDCNGTNGRTHFYQDEFKAYHRAEHGKSISGVGNRDDGRGYRTSLYNQDFNEKFFPFKKELDRIKIFNVSMDSGITVFPKISYKEFYKRLETKDELLSQDYLRHHILKVYYENYN